MSEVPKKTFEEIAGAIIGKSLAEGSIILAWIWAFHYLGWLP